MNEADDNLKIDFDHFQSRSLQNVMLMETNIWLYFMLKAHLNE